jgi:dipeptidyl aminopeptidase/acylaminoacyl peptidase
MFILYPPGFDETKKWPALILIHGGPQGVWGDDFHYRWNAQLFAAPGYVAAAINFHGSTSYGQEFTNSISKNWGGLPYIDIMNGFDYLANLPYIDKTRIGAAGGSYGGYMVNWLATQTDKFAALVSHAGVFNLESMYGATEELWFPEWDLGGPYWENDEYYKKWSPHYYVDNFSKFKTPVMVVHGQHDYRVPVTQGFEMYTALQRQGVPSRLLYYPDETHFVLKPQNAQLWYREVHDWFKRWLGVGPLGE